MENLKDSSEAEENRSSSSANLFNEVWPGSAEVNNSHQEKKQSTTSSSSSSSEEKRNWIQRRRNTSSSSGKATGMTRRCVCNLSQCASTNYMCKSERVLLPDGTEEEPGCFIEELSSSPESGSSPQGIVTESNGRVTSARRGCIEMLSREKQGLCRKHESNNGGGGGGIECCFQDDMCNYPKTFYPPHNPVSPQSHNNHITNSVSRIPYESSGGRLHGGGSLDHQVWLRAAVIAVPICGLIILIILIYVAKKLLSGEDDYKDNSSSGGGGRKGEHTAAEFLLPNPPPPPPLLEGGHCYWCSPVHGPPPPPRSTAYLLPQQSPAGIDLEPYSPDSRDTLWNHVQFDTSTQRSLPILESERPPPPAWSQRFLNWRQRLKDGMDERRLRPCHQV